MAEGVTIEQLRQEDHGLDVGVVGAHSPHGEGDDCRVSGRSDQLAHHSIKAPVHVEDGLGRRRRRGVEVKRMGGIHAVPQPFHGAVHLAGHRDEEVPVGEPLRHQPSRRAGAHVEGVGERLPHRLAARRRGPGESVGPRRGRVAPESFLELAQQPGGTARRDRSRIVSAPRHDPAGLRRAAEVHVGRVEDDDAPVETAPPRVEAGALLPHAIAGRIEFHRGPATGRVGREPGRDMLPRQPRALRGAMIEQEARRAPAQLGEGGHLPRGHEPLGEGHLQAIEADGKHAPIWHRPSLLDMQSNATWTSPRSRAPARLR